MAVINGGQSLRWSTPGPRFLGIRWSGQRAVHLLAFMALIGIAAVLRRYTVMPFIVGLMGWVAGGYRE
jgi:hypothetical protein